MELELLDDGGGAFVRHLGLEFTEMTGDRVVATARRGNVRLGVVLLDSPDPGKQATQQLDRGWKASSSE